MIQFRRLVSILLGAWLGAGIAVDLAVIQNFTTVDRFLRDVGSVRTAIEVNKIGRAEARDLLRRNAAEENNFLFENWEFIELGLGTALFLSLLFGDRPSRTMLAAAALMLVTVGVQRFALSPRIAELGRVIPGLSPEAAAVKTFWKYHGIYSGSELFKLGIGVLFALRLAIRRKPDPDLFRKKYETDLEASPATGKAR